MDRRNLIMVSVAAVLIAAAVFYYYASRPSAKGEIPREIKLNGACLACRQPVRLEPKLGDPQPYTCPKCGERAVYSLFICRACGKHFVPNLERRAEGEFPALPMIPSCPACGSTNVGGYTGDETVPADELILPNWPG